VRGFYEREFIGDRGFSGTFEVYSPDIAGGIGAPSGARVRLLAFYDYGRAWVIDPQFPQQAVTGVASVGPGLRVAFKAAFSMRLDYGFLLETGTPGNRDHGRANFSLVWVF
jgi:hemolysin activation/secretion protein